jgi:hypothetical protein
MNPIQSELLRVAVEVVNGGDGELVCCGEPMKWTENTVDAAKVFP